MLGIVLVAPTAEALIFRGAVFTQLARTRLRSAGAAVLAAVLFAGLHVQYGPAEMGLVCWTASCSAPPARTGSSLVPLLCHRPGNG